MRLLDNPLMLALLLATLTVGAMVVLGAWLILHFRRGAVDTSEPAPSARPLAESEAFAAAAVQGVIQRLKEQEKELARLRQAERERAQASETVSAAVLSNLASGVILFSPTGTVRQANEAVRSILGFASPTGLHARDLFRGVTALRLETGEAAPSNEPLLGALQAALGTGQSFRRLEADYTTPDGAQRVLGVALSPVRGSAGEMLGVTCLVSDLTEITGLARQIRLKDNLASLGEMSAGIAHEFKNSLATISGYAQMLTAENDAATVRQFASRIVAETGNLTRIVTDFLNFARPRALEPELIDLRQLLEECARECPIEVRLGLPEGFSLVGDRTALRQAFSNLLRNSAESGKNGVPVTVEVTGETDAQQARVVLRDNGAGIPAEDLARIFIPFFTTKSGGTGLGLALVHRIVTQHGGTIAVTSNPSGSTFTLSLPVGKPVPPSTPSELQ
ncbi:MAG TPA: ATP-binding protein [Terriglobales bacterium]|nr:ATP-binding protein [Terriglobales bacterium]